MHDWDALIDNVRRTFLGTDMTSTVKFIMDNGRNVWVQPTSSGPDIESDSARPADLELRMTMDDAVKILERKLGPKKAIIMGRLKTKGDMALAFRVAAIFSKPLN